MVRVLRPAPTLLVAMIGTAMLASCGTPPKPLPSAPPTPALSGGLSSSGAVPSLPGVPPTGAYPTGAYPTNPMPGATFPTQPTYTPPTYTTPTTTPPPSPAPVCGGSPTKQQVLNAVKGKPGIPTKPLEVRYGPYCAGGWQFTILGIVGQDEDEVDPLLLLTKGRPTSLRVVAAGADVCDGLDSGAPAGIKVRACGT
ncbi:hypothetical protein Acsp02_94620 [Actinoplanes sp. NBRC 103695]|nr:hypothetical protein Acsp02_94620 [Actinoplanes sp. NBRC 103695]